MTAWGNQRKAQRLQLPAYILLRLISSLMSGRQLSRKGLYGSLRMFMPEVCWVEGNPRVLSRQLTLSWCSVVKSRCLAMGWRQEYVIGYGNDVACLTWTLTSSPRIHFKTSGLSIYWIPKSEFSCPFCMWPQNGTKGASCCVECLCDHCLAQCHSSIIVLFSLPNKPVKYIL